MAQIKAQKKDMDHGFVVLFILQIVIVIYSSVFVERVVGQHVSNNTLASNMNLWSSSTILLDVVTFLTI